MGLIKDIYSRSFYDGFADVLLKVVPGFDKPQFMTAIFNADFKQMEWKQRMQHTTTVLHQFLAADFKKAVKLITAIIQQLRKDHGREGGLEHIFFADYIAAYGLKDPKTSIPALEFITQFISCEFAVRPFILQYPDETLAAMLKWSQHSNAHVRRLASEGSRPRLPWAMAIPALKKDPSPILSILENLKSDPSEYVRRSVANSLNDIAKDHPDTVISIAAAWKGMGKETDAIIKHGCRTLLKQGHAAVLQQYGLDSKNISLSRFTITTPTVKVGESLGFHFTIHNANNNAKTIRLEYGLYYKKSKGHLAKKVFKISERIFQPGEKCTIQRKQSFRLITTRVFHTGGHELSIIVNGEEKAIRKFELVD